MSRFSMTAVEYFSNLRLQGVSIAARGFWLQLNMIALAAKTGDEIFVDGKVPTRENLAELLGESVDDVVGWTAELIRVQLLQVSKGKPLRLINTSTTAPKRRQSRAGAVAYTQEFETFWKEWPIKRSKKAACQKLQAVRRRKSLEFLVEAAKRYAESQRGVPTHKILHASTWLNGDRWDDEIIDHSDDNVYQLHSPHINEVDLWQRRCLTYLRNGTWHVPQWGPEPDQPGTNCPPERFEDAKREHDSRAEVRPTVSAS